MKLKNCGRGGVQKKTYRISYKKEPQDEGGSPPQPLMLQVTHPLINSIPTIPSDNRTATIKINMENRRRHGDTRTHTKTICVSHKVMREVAQCCVEQRVGRHETVEYQRDHHQQPSLLEFGRSSFILTQFGIKNRTFPICFATEKIFKGANGEGDNCKILIFGYFRDNFFFLI